MCFRYVNCVCRTIAFLLCGLLGLEGKTWDRKLRKRGHYIVLEEGQLACRFVRSDYFQAAIVMLIVSIGGVPKHALNMQLLPASIMFCWYESLRSVSVGLGIVYSNENLYISWHELV